MATILVIDDDELVSRTLQRALKMYDYQVMTANSGIEGLQLARRHRPDLIILDIMMPGVDGYQVCRQIRGDPLLKELPVLFLTAKAKDEDKIEGFRAGADDYLVKPFNMQELELRVKAILRRVTQEDPEPEEITEVIVGNVVLDCPSAPSVLLASCRKAHCRSASIWERGLIGQRQNAGQPHHRYHAQQRTGPGSSAAARVLRLFAIGP
jgi:DNA-binding response OmpR family regulator